MDEFTLDGDDGEEFTPPVQGVEISDRLADLQAAGLDVNRVRLALDDYRLLHRDADMTRIRSRDLPDDVTVQSVEVVPDPDLDSGDAYAEVPVRGRRGPALSGQPQNTLAEFDGDRPSLTFDPDLVPPLLDGSKNATVRYDLDRDLSPGDELLLDTRRGVFAEATVGGVIRTDLSDALDAVDDAGYRHNAEDVVDLWTTLDGYYDDALGLSTEVAVVLLDDVTEVR